ADADRLQPHRVEAGGGAGATGGRPAGRRWTWRLPASPCPPGGGFRPPNQGDPLPARVAAHRTVEGNMSRFDVVPNRRRALRLDRSPVRQANVPGVVMISHRPTPKGTVVTPA